MKKRKSNHMFAAVKLRLHHPAASGKSSKEAWDCLWGVNRDVSVAIQNAMADVLLYLRTHRRFPTKEEREADTLPSDCVVSADLHEIVQKALRASGTSEYIWSSVSRRLVESEFSGDKLRQVLRGEIAYPVVRRPSFSVRNRNWSIRFETKIIASENGEPRKVQNPVVSVTSLRPGDGKFEFECYGFKGRGAASQILILEELAALGFETASDETGWRKGAMSVRWLPKKRTWEIILPYERARVERESDPTSTVVVHRGIVNMVMVGVVSGDDVSCHAYQGGDVVHHKLTSAARAARLRRDVSTMRGGRGHDRRWRALGAISDSEARYMDTACWRVARFVQDLVEKAGAGTVLIESFGDLKKTDVLDDQDRYLGLFVRKFPFAKLKLRIKDAVERRVGIKTVEIDAHYVSQKCPACDYTAEENIHRRPRAHGMHVEGGSFRCGACGLVADLDHIAVYNMLLRWEDVPTKTVAALKKHLARLAGILGRERKAAKEVQTEVRSEGS